MMTNNNTKSFCIKLDEYTQFSLEYLDLDRSDECIGLKIMCVFRRKKKCFCVRRLMIHETLWYSTSLVVLVKIVIYLGIRNIEQF